MQKWEYLVAACILDEKTDRWKFVCGNNEFANTQEMLNALGTDGWELSTTFSLDHTVMKGLPLAPRTSTYYVELHLKRTKG